MSRLLLGAILSGSLLIQHDPADACGLKPNVNAAYVNKPVKPTRHPSRVLVLGDAPDSVSRELKQAGHVVESADAMEAVKSRDFQVVLVSSERDVKRAQDQWTTAQVLPLKRRTRDNVTLVELAMAPKPIDTATGERREPVKVGPNEDKDRVPTRTGGGSDEEAPVAKAEPKVEEKPAIAARIEPLPEDPQPEQKKSDVNGAKLAKSVRFELASVRLSAKAKTALDEYVRYLRSNADATLHIEGHTDAVGSEEVNMVLAAARADNAKKYLMRSGIAESRITTEAFGESNPPYGTADDIRNRCIVLK
jgi:outer membrane protein OmpA-like peptidoglycan-associated protein